MSNYGGFSESEFRTKKINEYPEVPNRISVCQPTNHRQTDRQTHICSLFLSFGIVGCRSIERERKKNRSAHIPLSLYSERNTRNPSSGEDEIIHAIQEISRVLYIDFINNKQDGRRPFARTKKSRRENTITREATHYYIQDSHSNLFFLLLDPEQEPESGNERLAQRSNKNIHRFGQDPKTNNNKETKGCVCVFC